MDRYKSYKKVNSGLISEIPTSWKVLKVKHLVDRNTYYPVGDGDHGSIKPEMYQDNGIPYIRVQNLSWNGDLDLSNVVYISDYVQRVNLKSRLVPGDILIAKTGATVGKLAIIPDSIPEANTTSSVGKITIDKKRFNPFYILYCLQSKLVQDQIWTEASQKSAQPGFNIDDLIDFELYSPEITEQSQIAAFLDHHTGLIDALIAKKEALIEKLKQQRQAIINEVVTGKKVWNPSNNSWTAPEKNKDSGIEWLGEIPEGWEIMKLKNIATITRGAILRPVDDPSYFDEFGKWTYLNISDATSCDKYLDYGKLRLSDKGSQKSARVEPNNLIMTASATIGKMFINRIPVCVHDGFIPITNLKRSNIDFLFHYLGNPQLYIAIGKSNTQKNIYLDEVKNMIITLPSLSDQLEIVEYLEKTQEKYKAILNAIENQIEKLKLYRQSLISEAVTGKIDVSTGSTEL
jgi:type I restriction enzyme S subunit